MERYRRLHAEETYKNPLKLFPVESHERKRGGVEGMVTSIQAVYIDASTG